MTMQQVIDDVMRLGAERKDHTFDVYASGDGYNYQEHSDVNSYVTGEKLWRGTWRTLFRDAMYADMTMRDYLAACMEGRINAC